jgi:hypothetical protein
MLFKEVIAVYSEKHTEPINAYIVADLYNRWYIQLPLGFKGLINLILNKDFTIE